MSVMPLPTATGIFGMMRMIGRSPTSPASVRRSLPAHRETITKRSCRASSTSRMPSSMPASICGLTARNRKSASAAARRLSTQPDFAAPLASAEPMFPVPIKPMTAMSGSSLTR